MRNVKTWGILFLCLLLLPGVAYAQKRLIEGTVISQEDKEPLIGATVIVKGSLSGAETDLDGISRWKLILTPNSLSSITSA